MKIALIGYGKMGRLIEEIATTRGHQIVAKFSHTLGTLQERQVDLKAADIAIDFSNAASTLDHLALCLNLNKPLIIGTTGWEEHLFQAEQMVKEANGSCLYSPNFSLGVLLFQQIVSYAASLMQSFTDYDVGMVEYHHKTKFDSPSGTAKALKQTILDAMPRTEDFTCASVRAGHITGTHTILFDSPIDTITLTHAAKNKQGFAYGAVLAAEWLISRTGFFTMKDLL